MTPLPDLPELNWYVFKTKNGLDVVVNPDRYNLISFFKHSYPVEDLLFIAGANSYIIVNHTPVDTSTIKFDTSNRVLTVFNERLSELCQLLDKAGIEQHYHNAYSWANHVKPAQVNMADNILYDFKKAIEASKLFYSQYMELYEPGKQKQELVDTNSSTQIDGSVITSDLRRSCPAMEEVVECPTCPTIGPLGSTLIHLNDGHRWTPAQVLEWLETLPFDFSFRSTNG